MDALAAKGVTVTSYVAGEQPNARGAEALGLVPHAGALDSAGMFAAALAGKVRVLSLHGVNPVLHHPLGERTVRDALERVPFVVATELFFTESAQLATLILPVRAGFEKSGHTYALTGDVTELHAAHVAPEGTLADGDLLVALAAECGIAVPSPDELASLATAPVATAPHFADPALFGNEESETNAAPSGGGLRLAIAAPIFSGGGTVAFDDRIEALRPVPSATMSPATAAAAGLVAGDRVRVVAGERVLTDLLVIVDEHAVADVVAIVDGLADAPANAFVEGEAVMLDALVGGAV